MKRTSLFALLLLCAPVASWADEADDNDDMDFLDEKKAEEYSKKREADRAPSGDVFLDENEDEETQWKVKAPAKAADIDEDDDDIDGPTSIDADADEDGDPVDDFSAADRASMMRPLGDNFPLTLVAKKQNQVTVELPVLVAQKQSDFTGAGYWMIAQVVVNGTRISEGRQLVTKSSISEMGPTKVWFKLEAPITGPEADVEVRVFKQANQGSRPRPLFSRSLTIRM